MSFQTWTSDPGFPPADGRTRTTIGSWIVDYNPPTPPTLAQVQAQAAPSAQQILDNEHVVSVNLFQAPEGMVDRAVGLTATDAYNNLANIVSQLLNAINNNSTLGTIKTAVGAISLPPQVNPSTAKQAVINKLNNGGAD